MKTNHFGDMLTKIHFQIEYKTIWGEELYLVLNNFDSICSAYAMQNDGEGNWFLDTEIQLCSQKGDSSDKTLSYRYEVRYFGTTTRKEEETHHIPPLQASHLVIADRWHDVGVDEIEKRSIVIPYVHHRHLGAKWRAAGCAIPLFSLRSNYSYGIGDFFDLKPFIEWVALTGQSVIQMLPINDTTITKSWRDSYPYSANSSFALNPIYMNLPSLGPISDIEQEIEFQKRGAELNLLEQIDYERVAALKNSYIDIVYQQKGEACFRSASYRAFFQKNREWLEPYGIYCYLRDTYRTHNFSEWREQRYSESLKALYLKPKSDSLKAIKRQFFVQYHLHKQLTEVKEYAHSKGILLKGDLPIGVNRYSSDVWIHPELFHLECQAGAPPDAFAHDGQRWGMPTYNWEAMANDGYSWFIARFKKMADYFDAYRIDHLLGFFRIWEIPLEYQSGLMGRFNPALALSEEEIESYGFHFDYKHEILETRAIETDRLFLEDSYKRGMFHPRIESFETESFKALDTKQQTAYRHLHDNFFYQRNNNFWFDVALHKLTPMIQATGMLVCGEDLGMIPECVPTLMDRLRILSLEVQRMPKTYGVAIADTSSYPYLSVCTTSTHDMNVLRHWLKEEMPENNIINSHTDSIENCIMVLEQHLASNSMLAIFPLQDWLSIDSELRHPYPENERINVPANPNNYWQYRMHITIEKLLSSTKLNEQIYNMIQLSGR